MARIGSTQLAWGVLVLSFASLLAAACGGESDDETNEGEAGAAGTAGSGGSSTGGKGGSSSGGATGGATGGGAGSSSSGGKGGSSTTGSDCQTLECEPGSYCSACLTPDDVVFVCIPEGAAC